MTLTSTPGGDAGFHERARSHGLWVEAAGRGPDVWLVHGALGDYRQWTPIAERLRARYRVAAISRRYHWPNHPPPADALYSYESQCEDLLAYLGSSPQRVHLVGHSYGAGISLLAALRAPSLLQTLTLIEPPFASLLPGSAQGLEEEVSSRAAMLETVRALARQGSDEHAARMLVEWLQGGPGRFTGLTQDAQHGLLQNAKTVGPTFSQAAPMVTCDQLRELRVRALILRGAHTRPYFRLIAESVASCLTHARAAQIPDAAHMTIVERPAETAALLLDFLREGPPADRL